MAEFEPIFVGSGEKIAVGVSGGADSLCLAFLLHRWALKHHKFIVTLTVDHGLRAESSQEAHTVAGKMCSLGIEHHILTWEGEKPSAGIQSKAREARYHLLTQWCQANGATHLAMGHHGMDQVETALMRLSRGSGLPGLAGMQPAVMKEGIICLRPLLTFTPEALRATLREHNLNPIEDPSNQNLKFERVRWRFFCQIMPESFAEAVLDFAHGAHILSERIAREQNQMIQKEVQLMGGFLTFAQSWFLPLDPKTQLDLLRHFLKVIGVRPYPPKLKMVEGAIGDLKAGKRVITAHGCVVVTSKGRIYVARELRSIESSIILANGDDQIWDQRWKVENRTSGIVRVSPLGCTPLNEDVLKSDGRIRMNEPTARALMELPALVRRSIVTLKDADYTLLGLAGVIDHPQVTMEFRPRHRLCGRVEWSTYSIK